MKTFVLIIFFSIITFIAFGQNKSRFYNDNGSLIADTSIKINKETLSFLSKYEKQLIEQILLNIQYPIVCSQNNINEEIIARFTVDSLLCFHFIKLIKSKSSFSPFFEDALKQLFERKIIISPKYVIKEHIIYLLFIFIITKNFPTNKIEKGNIIIQSQEIIFEQKGNETNDGGFINENK